MKYPHRKTCKRYDVSGDAHFITFSCFRRLPLLHRDRSRQWLIQAIELGRSKAPFDLWTFVIMPEHVHLVLFPKENSPDFLGRIEDIQPNGKRHYRFWQRGGGYDRNLRSVRDIHEKIRYVHENPVRRGLVRRARDWKWSSASAWETGLAEPLSIDRQSVPPLTILDDDLSSALMQ